MTDGDESIKQLLPLPELIPQKIDYAKEELVGIIQWYLYFRNKNSIDQTDHDVFKKIISILAFYLDAIDMKIDKTEIFNFWSSLSTIISDYIKDITKEEIYDIILRNFKLDWRSSESQSQKVCIFIDEFILDSVRLKRKELLLELIKEHAKKNSSETLYKLSLIDDEVNAKAEEILKDHKEGIGYCHTFWSTKKKILKKEYNIDWYTPAEEHPEIMYD